MTESAVLGCPTLYEIIGTTMHRLKTLALALIGLALLAGLAGFVGWIIYAFFQYISSVPKELGAALVAASTTVIVATFTVMLGRYFERKKELDALYRDKKTEIYDEFLREFFTLFFDEDNTKDAAKDLVPFLREFTRKLILWSGPEVIEAFDAWKDHLAKGTPDAQSIFLTEAFLLAIRNDLRHNNKGLRKGFFARLFLKEGTLFLQMAEKNPNITLAELVEIENVIKAKERQ
ncbi:MAG: hypothetical protein M0P59_06460 [Gallionella sp.]|jgi:hypothetical protein|nr:hypothetical protein [Gallionella sp.]MCK9353786.1 hypothetical protein [Gallionella sp.]